MYDAKITLKFSRTGHVPCILSRSSILIYTERRLNIQPECVIDTVVLKARPDYNLPY